jgi:hypothetical protein
MAIAAVLLWQQPHRLLLLTVLMEVRGVMVVEGRLRLLRAMLQAAARRVRRVTVALRWKMCRTSRCAAAAAVMRMKRINMSGQGRQRMAHRLLLWEEEGLDITR